MKARTGHLFAASLTKEINVSHTDWLTCACYNFKFLFGFLLFSGLPDQEQAKGVLALLLKGLGPEVLIVDG